VLRLLTLWFDYGHYTDMYEALNEGLRTIDINTWLQATHTYMRTVKKLNF
jgi:hypothetical protein